MKKREYKNEGIELSLLGLGCMRLPHTKDGDKIIIDEQTSLELVDQAYKGGINYYDTAYFYLGSGSEPFMGKALSRYDRDSFYLATKMPMSMLEKPEDAERIFADQLAKLQTDHFDFYLCHAMHAPLIEKLDGLGVYDFLRKKKEEGAIRHLGFSFHDTPDVLEKICSGWEWDFAQIQLNYLDWEMQQAKEQYEILTAHGIPVVVMEPVRGGTLADPGEEATAILRAAHPDWSPASWALRYAASLPNVMTVLSGMNAVEQMTDNLATFEQFEPLTDADRAVLAEALEAFRRRTFVPCTACRYCAECPQHIDIPTVFKAYNRYALDHWADGVHKAVEALPEGSRPADCLGCGLCESLCPQHIGIPELMQKIAGI